MKTIARVHVASGATNYRQTISTGAFSLIADEPRSAGGQDAGPAPYDYLLASLGACTTITLQMYAERKGWQLNDLRVDLEMKKSSQGGAQIYRVLHCASDLSSEQWAKLVEIAGKTPVTRTLAAGAAIQTVRAEPS